ncbi:hypothetical protein, partial [Amycolatopsis sp. SID8362]|uniref:hypothetical protein n=1 Tax=Amycolatopsis sp. SID8362 TaxID=2690346 RepID=UPI00136DDA96
MTSDVLLGHGFPDVGVTVVVGSAVPVVLVSVGLPLASVDPSVGDSSGASALSGESLDSVVIVRFGVVVVSSRGEVAGWSGALKVEDARSSRGVTPSPPVLPPTSPAGTSPTAGRCGTSC